MTARSTRMFSLLAISCLAACSGSKNTSGGPAAPAPLAAPSAPTRAVAPAAPKLFEYAAGSAQYRAVAEGKGSQSVMGNTRELTSAVTRVLTIALARSAPDTLTMTLTLDSNTVVSSMPTLGAEKTLGAKFVSKLAPNGAFYSVTGPPESENAPASALSDEMGRALPRLRGVLANGSAWTDTISDKVKQNGIDVSRVAVAKFTVLGDTTVGGELSWKIQREADIKQTGAGTMQGMAVTLDLSGTSKGVLVISKKGVFMGSRLEDTGSGSLAIPAQNIQMTLTNSQTTRVTKVK